MSYHSNAQKYQYLDNPEYDKNYDAIFRKVGLTLKINKTMNILEGVLKGKKTKLAISLTITYALSGLLLGHHDANTAFLMITGCLGAYGIYDHIGK